MANRDRFKQIEEDWLPVLTVQFPAHKVGSFFFFLDLTSKWRILHRTTPYLWGDIHSHCVQQHCHPTSLRFVGLLLLFQNQEPAALEAVFWAPLKLHHKRKKDVSTYPCKHAPPKNCFKTQVHAYWELPEIQKRWSRKRCTLECACVHMWNGCLVSNASISDSFFLGGRKKRLWFFCFSEEEK